MSKNGDANQPETADSYRFLALVKFVTPTLPSSARHFWSELGFRYINGLVNSWVPFRIVSSTLGDMGDPKDHWIDVAGWFGTPWDPERAVVNVVCGPMDEISKFHTETLPVNVCITDVFPRIHSEADIGILRKYNAVWVRSWNVFSKLPSGLIHQCNVKVITPESAEEMRKELRAYSRKWKR